MGNLDRVTFGGHTVDRRTAAMLTEAQRLSNITDPTIGKYRLTQGSFSHSAAASAGTHEGPGAFDMYTSGYTESQKRIIGMALRSVGFASWKRERLPGKWEEHWHGIAMGTEGLPSIAQSQVRSYLSGRDGLAGNGRDPDPRPRTILTWEQYQQQHGTVDFDAPAAQPDQAPADPYESAAGDQLVLEKDRDHDGLTDKFEEFVGTSAKKADTDADGLSDGYEAFTSHTDPLSVDTDSDGIADAAEIAAGTDSGSLPGTAGVLGTGVFAEHIRTRKDSDSDGLSDKAEKLTGTDPKSADTDKDLLSDAQEAAIGTDPTLVDSDSDGLTDGAELQHGRDPLSAFVDASGKTVKTLPWTMERAVSPSDPYAIDSGAQLQSKSALSGAKGADADADADGLTDAFERLAGTRVHRADTDGDGMSDGQEALLSRDPLAVGGDVGMLPGIAGVIGSGAIAENVRDGVQDADRDGLSDHVEQVLRTDAHKADTDQDGLSDAEEFGLGTDPLLADTDGDGLSDAIELQFDRTGPAGADLGSGLPGGSSAAAHPADVGSDHAEVTGASDTPYG